ncbi:MAG: ABC transporter [Desulfobacterales bacterium]|nr:MAG: ABC transporter [Desulfobacterales bacterium]
MSALVEASGICFSYGGQVVLQDIDFTINRGDFIAVIGPNGGGKTTLVKLILGLLSPRSGAIQICGKPPGSARNVVGYVPQYIDHNYSFPATALDVVLMGLFQPRRRLARFTSFSAGKTQKAEALETLASLGVAELASRRISELSGGQRQRILIARALVAKPELLILDEPTASLDTQAQTAFLKLLQQVNRNCTILVVSHDLLGIAAYVKSVACVNRTLHFHSAVSSSGELIEAFYSTAMAAKASCPVEQLRQQLPVLQQEISADV